MLSRFALVALTLFALTAFAPAPFPRRADKTRCTLDLKQLAGVWRVETMWLYGPNRTIVRRIDFEYLIRFDRGQWAFCSEKNGVVTPMIEYDLRIDSQKRPATLDLIQSGQQKVWVRGLVRRDGEKLEVLYKHHATEYPTSFDDPPTNFYLFRLTRVRR